MAKKMFLRTIKITYGDVKIGDHFIDPDGGFCQEVTFVAVKGPNTKVVLREPHFPDYKHTFFSAAPVAVNRYFPYLEEIEVRHFLGSCHIFQKRALLSLFGLQTVDEQHDEKTRHSNGVGFSAADAKMLSSFTKQLILGRTLSAKQQYICRKRLPKYAKQIHIIHYGEA